MSIPSKVSGRDNWYYGNVFAHFRNAGGLAESEIDKRDPCPHHCDWYENARALVFEASNGGISTDNVVFNNVFYDMDRTCTKSWTRANLVENNIYMNCGVAGDEGALLTVYGEGDVYRNNIFFSTGTDDVIHNLIDGSQKGYVPLSYMESQFSTTWSGNIHGDPMFSAPSNDDFHLLSTSPGIDAGFSISDLLAGGFPDLDGNLVDPDEPDIGAYAFVP